MPRQDELRDRVLHELRRAPGLEEASIDVTVRKGVVKLSGSVPSYEVSRLADRTVIRVPGVDCIVDELRLEPGGTDRRSGRSSGPE